MLKNKKKRAEDLLAHLISAAEKDLLAGFVLELAGEEQGFSASALNNLRSMPPSAIVCTP